MALTPILSNNYYTRVLLGERAFFSGLGAITREKHLALAKKVLELFDVVLILESMSGANGNAPLRRRRNSPSSVMRRAAPATKDEVAIAVVRADDAPSGT